MKKKSILMKIIAVVLAITMLSSAFGAVTVGASSAYPVIGGESSNVIGVIFADILDTLLRFITDLFAGLFSDGPGFIPDDDAALSEKIAANYYEGTGTTFATTHKEDAKWNIGYSSRSLIPEDYDNGQYFLGGYISLENGFTNVVEGIAEIPGLGKDDMRVRCVAMDDSSGRGTVLFATIDCIGITNADIKDIRALLADFAAENNIVAINVAATHTHSCIDTEGLWTKNLAKLAYNGLNNGFETGEELQQGTNPAYMAFLKEEVAGALKDAYKDMKPGELTYTLKDIGQDYFNNKNRPSSGEMLKDADGKYTGETQVAMTEIHKFTFTPDDKSATPTIMLNMAAHPDVAGLPTESNSGREISGDYVFYCDQFLQQNGYNFMFFQGAIAAIYMARGATGDGVPTKQRVEESQRFGYELARILLALEMTEEEVAADPVLNVLEEYERETVLVEKKDDNGNVVLDEDGNVVMVPKNENYTLWYENWNKDANGNNIVPVAEEVAPVLNLAFKQVEVPVSNSLIEAIGKLNMANYVVISNDDDVVYVEKLDEDGNVVLDEDGKPVMVPADKKWYETWENKVSYSTIVEVAYMELGTTGADSCAYKAVFLPGEICQDLIAPDGMSIVEDGKHSVTVSSFGAQTACQIFGDDIACFGVMNDAIGYVVPDNDFTMGDPANHYHELISLGKGVSTNLMNGLAELEAEITYA